MNRAMKDSGIPWIGEIPEGWEVKKIDNLYTLRNEKVSDKDYPPLSVTMRGILPQLETAAKTNDGDNRKLVRKGDFAINSRSDRRGSCGISDYDGSVSLINTVLCPRSNMSAPFYNWLFHTTQFADEFYKWGHGIVDDLWTTRWQEMKSIHVVAPPLSEQEAIAAFLDRKCGEVDAMVSLQEQVIEELKAYKQSVITEAVTKGLNPNAPMKPSHIDWIGEIPEHWDMIPLKYFLKNDKNNLRVGPFGSALKGNDFQSEGVWVYNQRSVLDNNFTANDTFISEKKYEELTGFSVFQDDVLITTRGSIGKIAIVPKNAPKGIIHPCIIRFEVEFSKINQSLLLHIFNDSNFVLDQMRFRSNSTTIDVLYSYTLKEIKLPLIPSSEQREIADYLDSKCAEIDALIALKQQKIEELREYKKSLIYEYVTGKKQVFPSEELEVRS